MNTIWAIRELCSGKNGLVNLFNEEKSCEKLFSLADSKTEALHVSALLYGNARKALLALIYDAYHYKNYAEKVLEGLISDGLAPAEAQRTLEIFYEAFGFPGYRRTDPSREDTLVSTNGSFRTEYRGEVRNGKEHGVGVRTGYYDGEWCNYDECVWVDGVMCGYDYAKEMEFGLFEDKKAGFVADDCFIGTIRVFASSGEEFDDVGKAPEII